jgi:hypothetical protein
MTGARSVGWDLGTMSDDPPADALEFWVRFVCGVLAGAFIGFMLWLRWFYTFGPYGWIGIPAVALVCGLVAGWWGDRFWHLVLRILELW